MLEEDLVNLKEEEDLQDRPRKKQRFSIGKVLKSNYVLVTLLSAGAHALLIFAPFSSETKEAKKPESEKKELAKTKKRPPKTVKLSNLLGDSAPKPTPSPQQQVAIATPSPIVRPSPTLIIPPRRIPILASPSVEPIIITPTPVPQVQRIETPTPQPVFTPPPRPVFTPPAPRQPVFTPTPTPVASATPTPTPTPVASSTPTPSSAPPTNPFEKAEQYDDSLIGSNLFAEPAAFFTPESLAAEQQDPEVKLIRLPKVIAMNWQQNQNPEEVFPGFVEKTAKDEGLSVVEKGLYGGGNLYELQKQGQPAAWVSLVKIATSGKGTIVVTWKEDPTQQP